MSEDERDPGEDPFAAPVRTRRSALYLPASNARAIEKARSAPCDVVILDLEDAVAPEAKALARQQAVAAVSQGGFGGRELVVRVNALRTPWGAEDLAALAGARPDAVLVPKVDRGGDFTPYADALKSAEGGVSLWAMIETARSVLHLEDIASTEALSALVMGTNDLSRELGAKPDPEREPLKPLLSLSVAAARAYGRVILDGVFNDLEDDKGLVRECAQAATFGFDGKTLIHPKQIAVCNHAFTPTASEIVWAEAVETAFRASENRDKGAIRLEGRMVERLHLEQARKTLAVARAVGKST